MFNKRAFTLVEAMVVITLIAIFAALAVPSYRALVQNNRVVTMSSEFTIAFHYARSEAIRRGEGVSVCASANTSQTSCGTADNWTNGWIVFVDSDENGVLASTNDRIQVHAGLAAGASVTTTSPRVTFDSTGFAASGISNFTLAASGCTGNNGRQLAISSTGNVNVAEAAC